LREKVDTEAVATVKPLFIAQVDASKLYFCLITYKRRICHAQRKIRSMVKLSVLRKQMLRNLLIQKFNNFAEEYQGLQVDKAKRNIFDSLYEFNWPYLELFMDGWLKKCTFR